MTHVELFYWMSAIVIVTLQVFNHRRLGQGKLHIVYPLSMVIYFLYAVVETTLALTNPEQRAIMLFNLVNFWAFYNAWLGHRRLKKMSVTELKDKGMW